MKILRDYNKTALIFNNNRISYKELLKKIYAYSQSYKINKGDRVAIFSQSMPNWIYTFYSIWYNRGIVVPLDAMGTFEEIAYQIDDCKPEYVFISDKTESVMNKALTITKHKPKVINYENYKFVEEHEITELDLTDLDDIALIIYTSGTTGSPKGVMLSYSNLISNILSITNFGNKKSEKYYCQDDNVIMILPIHHIFPLQGTLLIPLFSGSTVVIIREITSQEIFTALNDYKITIILGVPRLFTMFHAGIMDKINKKMIAKLLFKLSRLIGNYKLSKKLFNSVQKAFGSKIRYFSCGGAKLDKNLAKDFYAMGFKILEGFGMSETSPIVTFNRMNNFKFGTVGYPLPNIEIKIENNELLIRGPNVMKGYYKKIEETKKAFIKGWLRTGDKAHIDKKGFLKIVGRIKDTIVLPNGKNIDPVEIENKIIKHYTIIQDIGIIEKNGNLLAIIYPNYKLLVKENITNITEHIKWSAIDKYNSISSDFKKIRKFKVVSEELPRTRIGKLKRFELVKLFDNSKLIKKSFTKPDFEEYTILEDFLSKFVEGAIFPDSHIEFDLGLDSLDKIQFLENINTTFGTSLTPSIFLEISTVEKLAKHIREIKVKVKSENINWATILKQKIDDFSIPKSHFVMKFFIILFTPLVKIYFRLKCKGQDKIPTDCPLIFAPNHRSSIDPLFLSMLLKRKVRNKTYYLAKDFHFKSKIRKFLANNGNIILMNFNTNLRNTLQKLAQFLLNGNNIVIFPEGTRSKNGEIADFKKAFAILSKELNIPIIPVLIDGSFNSSSDNNKITKLHKVRVEFLDKIFPSNLSYQEIAQTTKQAISIAFENLRNIRKKKK